MLTFEDCVAFCKLTEDEVAAIAEHEHIPEIVAVEFARYLVETESGERHIRRIIIEDMRQARAKGDETHAQRLELVLKHFIATHPRCATE